MWLTVSAVVFTFFLFWLAILIIEVKTLVDDEPDNHITASFRAALRKKPHLFVLVSNVLTGLFALIAGIIAGHIFHSW